MKSDSNRDLASQSYAGLNLCLTYAKKSDVMLYRSMTFKLNGILLDRVYMWLLFISILDIALQMISLMMRISIDNEEQYLFKGILYCESLTCVPCV